MTKLFIITLISYALASVAFLLATLGKKENLNGLAKILSLFAFLVLNIILLFTFTQGVNITKIENYLVIITWFLSASTLFAWYKIKNSTLFLTASPVFFLLLHTAMLRRNNALEMPTENIFAGALFNVHIIALLLAIIILFTAGIAAILFLIQEKAMKEKKGKKYKHIPPLEVLDSINYYATIIGFPIYTIGIICGFLFASTAWGSFFSGDIKEIISLCIFAGYGLLFHMRVGLAMKGKKPAMLLILLCLLSLFSLLAVNSLFDTHHQF